MFEVLFKQEPHRFPDGPIFPTKEAYFGNCNPSAADLRTFAGEQMSPSAMRWHDRVRYKAWLFRLTVVCWAWGYGGETWQANREYVLDQPECWISYFVDGYTPEEAMQEDASYA